MASLNPTVTPTETITAPRPAYTNDTHGTSETTGTSTPLKSTNSNQISEAPPSYVDPEGDMTLKTGATPNSNQQALHTTQPKPTQPPQTQIPNYVINLKDLGEEPDWIDCPHCKTRQKTTVSHPDSSATTLAGLFCCLFCGVITACIPCLCHWFAETDHHCSGCRKLVAHKPHDGQMEERLPVPPKESKYKASAYHQMSEEERRRIAGEGHGNGEVAGGGEKGVAAP